MNIASWLEIAGRSDARRPAIGLGERVLHDYRSFTERAARLAGALRRRYGLNPGDRVAIAAKNSPAFASAPASRRSAGRARAR